MLPRNNRLRKDKDFDFVFKTGRVSYDKIMGVRAVINHCGVNRFGILVSNKISKKAVERNKIKRRIREAARANIDKIKKGFDIIIVSLPNIKEKTFKEISYSLITHFERLKLFNISKK